MNALKSLPLYLGIDPVTDRPRTFIELHPGGDKPPGTPGGVPCILDRIYVHVVFKLGGIPDVDWLVYYGTSASAQRKPIQQRVNRR
jgi:hypothetical protein